MDRYDENVAAIFRVTTPGERETELAAWGRNLVADRDRRIAVLEQALKAIAEDEPCGQHHDAMAREALGVK